MDSPKNIKAKYGLWNGGKKSKFKPQYFRFNLFKRQNKYDFPEWFNAIFVDVAIPEGITKKILCYWQLFLHAFNLLKNQLLSATRPNYVIFLLLFVSMFGMAACENDALNAIDDACFAAQFSETMINGDLQMPKNETINGVNLSESYGAKVVGEWSMATDFENFELSITAAPQISQSQYEMLNKPEWEALLLEWSQDSSHNYIQQLFLTDLRSNTLYQLKDVGAIARTFENLREGGCEFLNLSFSFTTLDGQYQVNSKFRVPIATKI